jgi:phenylalanyl-tRNA synthetase beta chain
MKISIAWLKDWLVVEEEPAALADRLSFAGLEVGAIEPVSCSLGSVVVAEVLAVEPHPDADKLSVCSVSDGSDETFQIVCGAPNVSAGMRAALVRVGGRLGDIEVRRAKLRGVESQGMLCSERELGMGDEHDGIVQLPSDAPIGMDLAEYLGLDDSVLELELTPNRGDCLSVRGVARDLSAILDRKFKHAEIAAVQPDSDEQFPIKIEHAEGCPRFGSRVIRGIDPSARSPIWMRERLRRAGLRAISPAVDVTNYVMLELGQPMHAYDLRELDQSIVVRMGRPDETLTLLDGREVIPGDDVLVIADQSRLLGLAGIMGGERTGIADDTTDVLLECAYWRPEILAGRARRFGLSTDASHRFERGVDPMGLEEALERATALLIDIAGGSAGPVGMEEDPAALPARETVPLTADQVERLLGLRVPDTTIERILTALGFELSASGPGQWAVTTPSHRSDISRSEDLIEEVGRVHGYDAIPETPSTASEQMRLRPEGHHAMASLRRLLVGRGYAEVITYSFVAPSVQAALFPDVVPIRLANPISEDLSVMRHSLVPGLIQVAQTNRARGTDRIRIFEYGIRFIRQATEIQEKQTLALLIDGAAAAPNWDGQDRPADLFDLKGDLEALGVSVGGLAVVPGEHPSFHPGQSAEIRREGLRVGAMGRLHPRIARDMGLSEEPLILEIDADALQESSVPSYQAASRFPGIHRDLALVVPEEIAAGALMEAIVAAGEGLVSAVRPFDIYRGQGVEAGRKSVAFALILQDSSRTLTDVEGEAVVASIVSALEQDFGAKMRA